MKNRLVTSVVVVILTITTGGCRQASSQSFGQLRAACEADVRRICAGVEPGGGRIRECLKERHEQLSPACKGALRDAAAKRQ